MGNYEVDRRSWAKLSIFEQMGNIYSEVGRTFKAKAQHDESTARQAAVRAFDLFDATSEVLAAAHSPKLAEVRRVREIFSEEYLEKGQCSLDGYFLQYAVAARLRSAA